jgi:CDP-glucose 4,6-dehydratase
VEDVDVKSAFAGAYHGRRVLVTGHTGFKGSWLCHWLSALGAQLAGLALDPDTVPSLWHLLDLADVDDNRVDIRDAESVQRVVKTVQPEIVFHLAAQPLVRRGFAEPRSTFETNAQGTANLLDALRDCDSVRAIVVVTTDKVYRDVASKRPHVEADHLGGVDPYAASKACAELIVACYRESFFRQAGVGVATGRAGNVIGGGDWSADRLVPDCARAMTFGEPVRLRYPRAVRPWQHVLDALAGYLLLGQRLLESESLEHGSFNFGPAPSSFEQVSAVVDLLRQAWPGFSAVIDPRAGDHAETEVLRLDSELAAAHLGWRPVWTTDVAVMRTAEWYKSFAGQARQACDVDLEAFTRDAARGSAGWCSTGSSLTVAR